MHTLMLAYTHIHISAWSILWGLLIAALVYLVAAWLLGLIMGGPAPGTPGRAFYNPGGPAQAIAAILAVIVFVGIAFG